MIDLFGLGKNQDPQELEPAPEPADEQKVLADAPLVPAHSSRRLWAFLLVLDSVFVILFAGAVAAKVYQHWETPVAAAVLRTRHPTRRSIKEPAKTTAASAVTTETAQAPAAAPRPPKPSLLSDAPKHRQTPQLVSSPHGSVTLPRPNGSVGRVLTTSGGGTSSPYGSVAAGKVKALRVEFKLHAPKARSVDLLGAFIVRGGRGEMARQDDGTWTLTLYLNPGQYRYFFSVDKKRQLDPENPHSERGASLLSVP